MDQLLHARDVVDLFRQQDVAGIAQRNQPAVERWELRCVFDYGHCHDCDGEARLMEVSLEG